MKERKTPKDYMKFDDRETAEKHARELEELGWPDVSVEQLTPESWPVRFEYLKPDNSWLVRVASRPMYLRTDQRVR